MSSVLKYFCNTSALNGGAAADSNPIHNLIRAYAGIAIGYGLFCVCKCRNIAFLVIISMRFVSSCGSGLRTSKLRINSVFRYNSTRCCIVKVFSLAIENLFVKAINICSAPNLSLSFSLGFWHIANKDIPVSDSSNFISSVQYHISEGNFNVIIRSIVVFTPSSSFNFAI